MNKKIREIAYMFCKDGKLRLYYESELERYIVLSYTEFYPIGKKGKENIYILRPRFS